MYKDYIKTQDEALCHLFLHFCLKDGVFSEAEIEVVSKKFVALGLHADLNFKEEVVTYPLTQIDEWASSQPICMASSWLTLTVEGLFLSPMFLILMAAFTSLL